MKNKKKSRTWGKSATNSLKWCAFNAEIKWTQTNTLLFPPEKWRNVQKSKPLIPLYICCAVPAMAPLPTIQDTVFSRRDYIAMCNKTLSLGKPRDKLVTDLGPHGLQHCSGVSPAALGNQSQSDISQLCNTLTPLHTNTTQPPAGSGASCSTSEISFAKLCKYLLK